MAIFTVHLPPTAQGAAPAPEKIVFLRDGFSWPAFFLGPFWLLWRRAWIAAAAWTALLTVIGLVAWKLKISRDAMSWLGLSLAVWLGLEGERIVAWALARRGYVETDVVVGDDEEEAEMAFFHRWRGIAPQARSGEQDA
ncbi:DUF2628 domain-containing protein [Methylocystis sp. ATCC 49242]|uniref:DUF2628 domain-containing protein n=1 Tax=Methylocystis sp. ATCC 49242 TaxID=622637 RepID=UPI0001F8719C|nr:DUF2628 domain-containing protein [Methylocystis sp. ATCC 49242]